MMTNYRKFAAVPLLLATASPAFAHPGHGSGLVAGLVHPFTGLDHLAAMLAVGMWAATRPARQAWQAPVVFMALLAAGGLAGVASGPLPGVELAVALSVAGLGLMLGAAQKLGSAAGLGLIGLFALVHGLAHGAEASGALGGYFAGFLTASAVLHALGWAAGRALHGQGWAQRLAGLGLGVTGVALAAMQ